MTIFAGCGNSLLCFLHRTFLGHGVYALPVISRTMACFTLDLPDDLSVWNRIWVETLVTLDTTQRLMHRPFELCSVDKERDSLATLLHRQRLVTMACETVLGRLPESNQRENQKKEREENDLLKPPHGIFRAMNWRSSCVSLSFNEAFQLMRVVFFLKEYLLK